MDPNTPQTPLPAAATPQSAATPEKPEEWKLIVTIASLVLGLLTFVTLVPGIIFMWLWMKNWPRWLKILITVIPIIFLILWFVLFAAIFVTIFQNIPKLTPAPAAIISTPAPASDSAKAATSSANVATSSAATNSAIPKK